MTSASSLQGPGVVWGSEGVMLGHDENDLKGYDNFGSFVSALNQFGLAAKLQSGTYTVFMPTDSAVANFGPLTEEICMYHIVEGKIPEGSLSSDLTTIGGKTLKAGRRFRKTFMDDAIIGQEDNFGGGSKYPTDIDCDNGYIHAISIVLNPALSGTW
eukprot:CAMPEP_0118700344 /NCGR_PEP_ID=MMETSP0800-20121206/16519_1 /TAXON_ID=210618 ORGANISM="Striatella unipunctata, Strain CCMP2910" /NCGR_SAMPLE_ID=MMETSP0800 /ASSEMBLY_ACC=CAM_ASM_000638 /LENGTH=156 /DNA_ID=CAMNT_0006600895 /DNA_START=148 /DNA_END=618 /DNA_ORIENTATION=-